MKALSKMPPPASLMLDALSRYDNILVIMHLVLDSIVRIRVPFIGSLTRYG